MEIILDKDIQERPEHLRRPLRGSATLELAGGRRPVEARLLEAGESDITIVSERNLPVMSKCEIRFQLPLGQGAYQSVHTPGLIVYCAFSNSAGGFKAGVRLTNMSAVLAERLFVYAHGQA